MLVSAYSLKHMMRTTKTLLYKINACLLHATIIFRCLLHVASVAEQVCLSPNTNDGFLYGTYHITIVISCYISFVIRPFLESAEGA